MDVLRWPAFHGDYLRSLTAASPPDTVRTYGSVIKRFADYCAAREINPVDAPTQLIETWIGERLAAVSRSTVYGDLAALKAFYRWAVERDHCLVDPTSGLRVKREKVLPTKPATNEQIRLMLASCTTQRDRLMLLVFGATGCRISELACMRAEDLDREDYQVRIHGKGSKERLAVLPAPIMDELRDYLPGRRSGPLWMSEYGRPLAAHQIRKIIYRIAKAAGVEDMHPHRFRAGFATSFLEETGDIQALQVIMGHESIATTARYTEHARMKRAMDLMRRYNPAAGLY